MNTEHHLKIILAPYISEKSTVAMDQRNEYAFKVMPKATKHAVKDAVEKLFNVKVKSVRIMNVRSKVKIFKGVQGKKKGWKKAYVTLQADQKIEVLGAGFNS